MPIPPDNPSRGPISRRLDLHEVPSPTPEHIRRLADPDPGVRAQTAWDISRHGAARTLPWLDRWLEDQEFGPLVVREQFTRPRKGRFSFPRLTTGVAVLPETFKNIHAANGSPRLADAAPGQDALEFELEFTGIFLPPPRVDIITTSAPGGGGAIARFLDKFGEAIQQVEIDVTDVDRATEIARAHFHIAPIYPTTRPGANGTRVNFFLAATRDGGKVLVELVEQPRDTP